MRTEAPSGLVICNLPRSRSPLRVASPGKPFLREVPPFLPALLRQLQNRLDIAWAINVVFTHVLPWSRPAVFVEGNFLMANQARNVLPLFSSSTSRRWRGAPHQAIVLIVHKQRPNPPWRSLAPFSLGARLLLLLDLDGRFPSPVRPFPCFFLGGEYVCPSYGPLKFLKSAKSGRKSVRPFVNKLRNPFLPKNVKKCLKYKRCDI